MAVWKFGQFELDVEGFRLLEGANPVKLERIPLELLILLVEHQGQLVSRERIAERLWGGRVHVDVESGVNTAVRKLRSTLKDSPERPLFIETVPGKGYRFIGSPPAVSPATPAPETRPKPILRSAGLAIAIVMSATLLYVSLHRSGWPASSLVTVAVMPFQNLSNDPEQAYLGEGLTEETITALGRVNPSRIRVIARTSSMAYRSTRKTAGQIGAELGAGYLVEGSVRRDPERVRITAKLIRVNDQLQLWNASFDRAPDRFLGLQDEIATAIALQIGGELAPAAVARPPVRPPENTDSYDLYLRGRYYLNQRASDFLRKSAEYFQAAIRKDDSFAPGFAGYADVLVLETFLTGLNPLQRRNQVREATGKALSLDPNLAEAHVAAGMADFFMGWDWASAERSFRRAIELNPNHASAHAFYAHLLSNSLRHDEAIAHVRKARDLDPLSPMMHTFAGQFLLQARRYREAQEPLKHALAIDPDFFPAHAQLGYLYEQTGNAAKAIEEFRKAFRLSNNGNLLQLANQGFVLGRAGRRAEAVQIMSALNRMSGRFVPPYVFALIHAGLGNREEAIDWLEKARQAHDSTLVFLPVDPKWDSLRADARFRALLTRCGFRTAG